MKLSSFAAPECIRSVAVARVVVFNRAAMSRTLLVRGLQRSSRADAYVGGELIDTNRAWIRFLAAELGIDPNDLSTDDPAVAHEPSPHPVGHRGHDGVSAGDGPAVVAQLTASTRRS